MESVPEFVPPTEEEVKDLLAVAFATREECYAIMDSPLFCTVLMAGILASPLLEAFVESDSWLFKKLIASGIACYIKAQQDKEKAARQRKG